MATPTERIDRFDVLYRHAQRMPSAERADRMVQVYLRYAGCWLDGDLDGMSDCLVAAPVVEHYPQCMRIAGREAVLTRAQRLTPVINALDPRSAADRPQTRAVAFGEDVLVHEHSAVFPLVDGTSRRCYLAAVVVFHGDRIAAERIYTDEQLAGLVNETLGADFAQFAGVSDVGDDGGLLPEGGDQIGLTAGGLEGGLDCPAFTEAARRVPSPQRVARMVECNLSYMQHFFDGDFDAMFKTLVDTPVFEQFPRGIRIEGHDAVYARNSRGDHKDVDPRKWSEDNHRITASCGGEDLLIHEFSNIFSSADGTPRRGYMLAIIPYEGDKLVGERVYSSGSRGPTRAADFEEIPGVTVL